MNRCELKERLVAAGVPEDSYFIVGIDSQRTPGKGGGFGELVLTRTEDELGWRLLTEERGRIQREDRFATEGEACEQAWEELKPGNTPLRRRTAQERERSRQRAREMVAEYRRLRQDSGDRRSPDPALPGGQLPNDS